MQIEINYPRQDYILAEINPNNQVQFKRVIACHHVLELLLSYKNKHYASIMEWPIPTGSTHAELILKEFILKAQNKWVFPYDADELCHCRAIQTKVVNQAIINGIHETTHMSLTVGTSTACGTCRPHVQDIIDHYLHVK